MNAETKSRMDPWTIIVGLACFAVGVFVGIALLISAQVRAAQAAEAQQPPRASNMELLGQVETVIDPDDPLVAELKADDLNRQRNERDEWK